MVHDENLKIIEKKCVELGIKNQKRDMFFDFDIILLGFWVSNFHPYSYLLAKEGRMRQ